MSHCDLCPFRNCADCQHQPRPALWTEFLYPSSSRKETTPASAPTPNRGLTYPSDEQGEGCA